VVENAIHIAVHNLVAPTGEWCGPEIAEIVVLPDDGGDANILGQPSQTKLWVSAWAKSIYGGNQFVY